MNIHEIRIYPTGWKGVVEQPCVFIALRDSMGRQPFGYATTIPENAETLSWVRDALDAAQDHYWAHKGKLPSEWKKVVFSQTEEARILEADEQK